MADVKRRRTPLIALSVALPLIILFAVTELKYLPAYLYDVLDRSCPEQYRGPAARQPFLVVGHRGAAAEEVENTLRSYRRALEVDSVNGLELDLCMTKDGVIVIWHDWDPDSPIALAREAGLEPDVKFRPLLPATGSSWRRPVHTLTLAELRAHYGFSLKEGDTMRSVPATIPTLDEFLAFASRYDRLRLVYFDLKIPEEQAAMTATYFNSIRKSLEAYTPRFTVVFMTPHQKIFDQIEQIYPGDNITFDVEPPAGIVLEPWELNSVRTAIARGNGYASTVHPKASTWAPWTTLKRLVENDVRMRDEHNRTNPTAPIKAVVAATITAPESIRCLIATGVDGLITDDPKRLREIAREMGRVVD